MDCPVCGNKKISPFSPTCLECGADVVAFPLLDEMEEQYIDTLKDKVALEGDLAETIRLRKADKRRLNKRMNRAYLFLLLMPLLFFWCGRRNVVVFDENLRQTMQDSIQTLDDHNLLLSDALVKAHERVAELERTTILHVIKDGDNFADLAERYLGTEARWEEIQVLNLHVKNPRNIPPGTKVLIKLSPHKPIF